MPLKADNTNAQPEIEALLRELGNEARGLPYYALFIPGQDEPKHFPGVFVSSGSFLSTLNEGVEIPVRKDDVQPAVASKTTPGEPTPPVPAKTANRM